MTLERLSVKRVAASLLTAEGTSVRSSKVRLLKPGCY